MLWPYTYPMSLLKPALGWSRYRDAKSVPTIPLTDEWTLCSCIGNTNMDQGRGNPDRNFVLTNLNGAMAILSVNRLVGSAFESRYRL